MLFCYLLLKSPSWVWRYRKDDGCYYNHLGSTNAEYIGIFLCWSGNVSENVSKVLTMSCHGSNFWPQGHFYLKVVLNEKSEGHWHLSQCPMTFKTSNFMASQPEAVLDCSVGWANGSTWSSLGSAASSTKKIKDELNFLNQRLSELLKYETHHIQVWDQRLLEIQLI